MTTVGRIRLVVRRAPHHAGASGYDRLAEYLGAEAGASVVRHKFPPRGTWRLARPFARRAGLSWYGTDAFLTEIWAAGAAARSGGIVHFLYGENSYRYAAVVPRGRGRRLVATLHLPPSVFAEYVHSARHLERLDAVVLVARSQLEILERLQSKPAAHVIPHGVDVEYFRPPDTVMRHERCLFVGRWLRDFACLGAVVEAVHRAAPRVRFTLVLPPELMSEWSGRPGVDARSGVDDAALLRAYQESALLVMPLRDTTANNAVLEAMACGLPVIATDVGGMRDYVDRDCARLAPAGNPEAMTAGVLELMQNPAARTAMGQAARSRAEVFAWPRVAKQIVAMYEALT